MTFSYLPVPTLILTVPHSIFFIIWNAKLKVINFDFIFSLFFWLTASTVVIHLSLCKISVLQLCTVKWLKIAFELCGGGYGQIWPGRAFPAALIPKWHSNMLVIRPRSSPTISPLLGLQMFISVQSDLLEHDTKSASANFSETALTNSYFLDHLAYLCHPAGCAISLCIPVTVFIFQEYNLNILLKSCQSHLKQ